MIEHHTFRLRLESRMAALGLKQADLAVRVGVAPGVVSRWLAGSYPHARFLPALADALDVTLDYLLRGEDDLLTTPREVIRRLEGATGPPSAGPRQRAPWK